MQKQNDYLEQLKQLNDTYNSISNLLDEEDLEKEEFSMLNDTMKILDKTYNKIYQRLDDNTLKTNKCCSKCSSDVLISDNIKYSYQCLECDENLYEFETYEKYSIENSDSISNSFDLELCYIDDRKKLYIGTKSSSGCEYECKSVNEFMENIKDYYYSYIKNIDENMEEELC